MSGVFQKVRPVSCALLALCFAILPLVASAGDDYTDIERSLSDRRVVSAEAPSVVELSNIDVNRITCEEDITDVVFSEEKSLQVKVHGKNAFVKFQLLEKTVAGKKEVIRRTAPVELYVICSGSVYTIIGVPKDIPAKTIQLGSSLKKKIEKNLGLFGAMATEKRVAKLIQWAYTEKIPESFTVKEFNTDLSEPRFDRVSLTLRRSVIAEGTGFVLNEYYVTSRASEEIELHERDFIPLSNRLLAISIEKLKLAPGERTRLFLVEVKNED